MSNVKLNGTHSTGYMTLKEVIMDYKERWSGFGDSDIYHIQSQVIRAIQYLNIFSLNGMDVIYMQTDGSSAITLPSDFIDYTKIGVIDACGQLWTLTLNENVFQVPITDCGIDLSTALTGRCNCPTSGYWWAPYYGADGTYNNTLYSLGGGFNIAYYNIDRQGRKLIINGLPADTTVVMEYKSTGIKMDDTTIIGTECLEAIVAWIDWQEAKRGRIPMNPQLAERDFEGEESRLKNLQLRRTVEEYADIIYEQWHLGIKRGLRG